MLTRGEWFGSAALNALLLDIAEGSFAPLRAPRSTIPLAWWKHPAGCDYRENSHGASHL